MYPILHNKRLCLLTLVCLLGMSSLTWASPIEITDDAGKVIHLDNCPRRVVSLVPSATEIIFAIGAGDALSGIAYHSASIRGAAGKTLVGGFFSPSTERVMALKPDLVIVSSWPPSAPQPGPWIPIALSTQPSNAPFRAIRCVGPIPAGWCART